MMMPKFIIDIAVPVILIIFSIYHFSQEKNKEKKLCRSKCFALWPVAYFYMQPIFTSLLKIADADYPTYVQGYK